MAVRCKLSPQGDRSTSGYRGVSTSLPSQLSHRPLTPGIGLYYGSTGYDVHGVQKPQVVGYDPVWHDPWLKACTDGVFSLQCTNKLLSYYSP